MSALKTLRKNLAKKDILTEMNEPTHWISTGNAVLNYRLTGRLDVGIPNKRTFLYWGESGTGKSYLSSNAVKNAQADGYLIIYLDSEGSISEDYMEKVGIDLDPELFIPVLIDTIEDATSALSEIFQTMDKSQKFIIVIDSLAGMSSEKEEGEFEKGIMKGDMGQSARRYKLFVKNINKKIQDFDAFCVMVTHAYQNQDILNGEGKWICTGGKGFQFFPSMGVMLEKAKLKDGSTVLDGVKIKATVTKTRFTSPFQKCELKVPYSTGIDFTDGLVEVMEELGVVSKSGAWYNYEWEGETVKFQGSKFKDHYERLMEIFDKEHAKDLVEKEEVVE